MSWTDWRMRHGLGGKDSNKSNEKMLMSLLFLSWADFHTIFYEKYFSIVDRESHLTEYVVFYKKC